MAAIELLFTTRDGSYRKTEWQGRWLLALELQITGSQIGMECVFAASRPRKVFPDSRIGPTEGTRFDIPHLHGSIHGRVIVGITNRDRDVSRLAVNLLVAGDGRHLETAPGEMEDEVGRLGHLDGRFE